MTILRNRFQLYIYVMNIVGQIFDRKPFQLCSPALETGNQLPTGGSNYTFLGRTGKKVRTFFSFIFLSFNFPLSAISNHQRKIVFIYTIFNCRYRDQKILLIFISVYTSTSLCLYSNPVSFFLCKLSKRGEVVDVSPRQLPPL